MEVGIFSKTFSHYPFETTIQKVKSHGFSNIQFNFSNLGIPSLPETITPEQIDHVRSILDKYEISLSAVSGTFNTLDPNRARLAENINRFKRLVKTSYEMGSPIITICTGSFHPNDMWADHPDNVAEAAWGQLIESLLPMLDSADRYGIVLAFEPEQTNVIRNAKLAKELMDTVDSSNLKVLFDAANIINTSNAGDMEGTIEEGIKLLHNHIALAHCKDLYATSSQIEFQPVGKGNLPFKHYLTTLAKFYSGPLVMHGVEESDVEYSFQYINLLMKQLIVEND